MSNWSPRQRCAVAPSSLCQALGEPVAAVLDEAERRATAPPG
ncbi:hypothetical protein [Prauserella flavalba]